MVSLLAAVLVACAPAPAATPASGVGTLVVTAAHEEPPAGQPISIGGYGYFASIDGGPEEEVPFDAPLRMELAAGPHELTIVTRPASDVLIVGEDGEPEREFYDVSTGCEGEIDVPTGGEVHVTYHAVGGDDCRVTVNEE